MIIVGTSGNDDLDGTVDDDLIQGLAGDDILDGIAGNDQLEGGADNDFYKVRDADTIIVELAGEGTDIIHAFVSYTLTAGASVELLSTYQISATDSIDLTGNELVQTIWGNNGSNILRGGGGADTMLGFGGNDTYYITDGTERVLENAGGGTDVVLSSVSYTLTADSHVELLSTASVGGTDDLSLTGNALAQTIWGNQGENTLRGGGGADTLIGFGGDDVYFVTDGQERIIEEGSGGTDIVYASVSFALATGASVELLSTDSIAGTAAINLTGNDLNNTIWGNNGTNTLNGLGGADVMAGFGGDDIYVIDNAADIVVEQAGQGNDTIQVGVTYTLAAGVSVENIVRVSGNTIAVLRGNEIAQTITGGTGDDTLFGGGGDDTLIGSTNANSLARDILDGGTGADTMVGGNESDIYYVDNIGDVVTETGNQGNDIVYTTTSYTLAAGTSVELLSTISIADTTAINLTGNDQVNHVWGNNGDNIVNGGLGNDVLYSFNGNDIYAFTTALGANNVDRILDFSSGLDRIGLDDAIFSGIGTPGSFNAGAFVNGTAAGDADDRIIYDQATGNLFYDADGNGAGAAVLFATFDTKPALTQLDFAVI